MTRRETPWLNVRDGMEQFLGRWIISAPRWHSTSKLYNVEPKFFALLRVSKAFYHEAPACLWSQDSLISGNADKLCRLLQRSIRWKYVKQIELELEGYCSPGLLQHELMSDEVDCIAVLASMPRLRKLVVRLSAIA